MAVAATASQAPLRRSQQPTLAFDRPCPQQRVPVIAAGGQGKGRGNRQDLRSELDKTPVELAETQVVADGQAQPSQVAVNNHRLVARGHGLGLGEPHLR